MAERRVFSGSIRNHPLAGGARGRSPASARGGHRGLRDLYESDHGATPPGGRFRWLVSTMLAATVGSIAIFAVIYGSSDTKDASDKLLPALRRIGEGNLPAPSVPVIKKLAGLNWFTPKSDRMEVMSAATTMRFVIHEKLHQRRNGREYIHAKPYVRVLARLAAPSDTALAQVPAFNPFKLYANNTPISNDEGEQSETQASSDVVIRVVELLGGILPVEDQQKLELAEVTEIVVRSEDAMRTALGESSTAVSDDKPWQNSQQTVLANTTLLQKTTSDSADSAADFEDGELSIIKVGKGESLLQILTKAGADRWQAKAMIEAGRGAYDDKSLEAGNEIHLTLVASLTDPTRKEPARFSVFADGHVHKVTVSRGPSGEFEASQTPLGAEAAVRALVSGDDDALRSASLYASTYYALQQQQIGQETILEVLKIHAYETDFRRRLRAGDQVELFFDVKDEAPGDNQQLGELLYTAITAGGETSRFYRFRTPDGIIDFYDAEGSNSKKFLMRRPVRSSDVRLTSGFGFRNHPLLGDRKMHTGVDWAAPSGTPILAAGNGIIEQAGRKGQYGNYVRIRHANGYQTAYGHMSRIAAGVHESGKVRQGQVIGFVGTTGMSSGPHLHFEVLVNSRFVNPMSIQVPRERQLDGRQLADFQKERARIDDLMRRAPVLTASKQLSDAR